MTSSYRSFDAQSLSSLSHFGQSDPTAAAGDSAALSSLIILYLRAAAAVQLERRWCHFETSWRLPALDSNRSTPSCLVSFASHRFTLLSWPLAHDGIGRYRQLEATIPGPSDSGIAGPPMKKMPHTFSRALGLSARLPDRINTGLYFGDDCMTWCRGADLRNQTLAVSWRQPLGPRERSTGLDRQSAITFLPDCARYCFARVSIWWRGFAKRRFRFWPWIVHSHYYRSVGRLKFGRLAADETWRTYISSAAASVLSVWDGHRTWGPAAEGRVIVDYRMWVDPRLSLGSSLAPGLTREVGSPRLRRGSWLEQICLRLGGSTRIDWQIGSESGHRGLSWRVPELKIKRLWSPVNYIKTGGRFAWSSLFAKTSAKMSKAQFSESWDDSVPMCLRTNDDLALKMPSLSSKRSLRGSLSKSIEKVLPWFLVLTVGRFSQPPSERWIIQRPANRERGVDTPWERANERLWSSRYVFAGETIRWTKIVHSISFQDTP